MTLSEATSLALALSMAIAAGLVGCFAVMRRMTLAADAISHVALPGVGLALILGVHPGLGAVTMLLLGAVLIWVLETRTKISTEAIIGVVFSVALAAGSIMTSGDELIEALFGRTGTLTNFEVVAGLIGAAAVIAFILSARNQLVVSLVSPDVALTCGINVSRLNLLYLVIFAFTIALGLRYLGVLLMGSLIIIPAVTARGLARSLNGMLAIAVALAMVSTVVGSYVAGIFHRPTGPFIISIAGGIFLVSLLALKDE